MNLQEEADGMGFAAICAIVLLVAIIVIAVLHLVFHLL